MQDNTITPAVPWNDAHLLGLEGVEPTTTPPTLYPVNTLICGFTGAGKTHLVEQMTDEARKWLRGLEVWEVDNAWQTPGGARAALDELLAEIDYRETEMLDQQQKTCRRPQIIAVLDPSISNIYDDERLYVAAVHASTVNLALVLTAQSPMVVPSKVREHFVQRVYLPEQGWYVYKKQ